MAKQSAGVLLYRFRQAAPEVLLVHPGGPFWAKKDAGACSIPKGEAQPGQDLLARAQREFAEESGFTAGGRLRPVAPLRPTRRKIVHSWAGRGRCHAAAINRTTFFPQARPRSRR